MRLIWRKGKEGHILEKCLLQTERAGEIYAWLQRRTRKQKEEDVDSYLPGIPGQTSCVGRFLQYVEQRIGQGQSVAQYVDTDHPQAMAERCGLIPAYSGEPDGNFLREFSVRFLKDSKAAEKEDCRGGGHYCPVFPENTLTELTAEQVLEEFNILKNPSWVMAEGQRVFTPWSHKEVGGQDAKSHAGQPYLSVLRCRAESVCPARISVTYVGMRQLSGQSNRDD